MVPANSTISRKSKENSSRATCLGTSGISNQLSGAHSRDAQPAPQPLANIIPGKIAHDAPPAPPIPPCQVASLQQHHQTLNDEEEYPVAHGWICMIQEGRPSNRQQKQVTRQVYLAATSYPAILEYLQGSEIYITFSREDHLPAVPRPVHAALVLEV